VSASSIPLKIKNSNGDLQEFTPAQENYLAYAVGQVLAEASAGDVGDISLTDGNSIGSFTDAYYNEPAGTHPLSNLTTTTTTTTLKQVAGPADESGADFTRPVGYYENGPNPGFYEMVDADLDNLAGRVIGNMAQNNYTGTFKLAKTSPGADYSVFIENAFSDTHGDGTVENYSIYQRVTMPAVDAHRPVTICYDDDASVAVNLSDVSSLNLYQGQDTVITAAPTDSNGDAITWSFEEVKSSLFFAADDYMNVYDPNTLQLLHSLGPFQSNLGTQIGSMAVGGGKYAVGDGIQTNSQILVYDINDLTATPTTITDSSDNGFGKSIALSDDKLYVGMWKSNNRAGGVLVYDLNDLSASPTEITSPYPFPNYGRFGDNNLEVVGNKVFISQVRGQNGEGVIYVYDNSDLSATPIEVRAPGSDSFNGDGFGWEGRFAVSDTHLIVGQIYGGSMAQRSTPTHSGLVHIYDISDLSAAPKTIQPFDATANGYFGYTVEISNDYIVVGAKNNNTSIESFYTYNMSDISGAPHYDQTYKPTVTKIESPETAGQRFGKSIRIIENQIFVSVELGDTNGTNTGSVYVYDATDLTATPQEIVGSRDYANFGNSMVAYKAPSAASNGVTVTQSDNVFTVTPGSSAASFKLRFTGDETKDVDFTVSAAQKFDGFKEMTDAQIKYSLGQRVKSLRATAGAIGSYQLRSSAQGAPIMPGTWLSAGTATNTRRSLVDVGYTRTRNSSYVRSRVSAYTRDRISTFTRNSIASFARTFTGDYTGEYSRGFTGNYSRDFVGNYSRTRTSTFDGTYTRGRLSTFAADYVRSRVSTYDGTFSRNRLSTYSRESTRSRNSAYTQVFSRTRASAFIADYTRARTSTYDGTFARDRISSYIDTYTRTRPSTFAGNFTTTRTSTYDGTFSRVRNSSYTGTYSRDRVSSYAGTYTRERASTYTGEYTRARTSTFDGTFSQLRTSSFSDTYARTRTSSYDGTYARTRTSTYDGTYARTRVSSYVDTYTRTRNSTFSASYTRERPSSYSGEFTRNRTSTFDGTFSRTRNSSYSGTFTRTRVSSYIDTYSRARISSYSGTFARNRISSYSDTYARTRNSIYTGQYTRTRTSTFDGTFSRVRNSAYAADYTRTRTSAYGATYSRVRASAYTRTRLTAFTNSYSGTFSRARVSVYTRDRVTNFAGIFARTRTSAYTRGRVSTYSGTFARARTSVYSAAYSRTRVSSYTGTYAGTFSRTRISAYSDTYSRSRNSVYTRTSARTRNSSYSADYTRTRVTDYTRNRVTNFAGVFSRARVSTYARTRTSVYSAAYARDRVSSYVRAQNLAQFTGNFAGNYSRNFAGNYSRNFVGNYSRGFAGNYVGNYARVSTRVSARTRYSAYARTSTRTRASAYTRDRVTNFAGNFVGNYSRNFIGDYVGNYSRTFVGDYTGNYTGNYARTFTGNFAGNYARAFAGNYAGNYTGNYTTTFTGNFVGNYARNFVGDYVGNFVGNYARAFAGNFAGNYVGEYTRARPSSFVGNYARGFVGNYVGNFVGNYARAFAGNFAGNYTGNYATTFTGNFVGNYARGFAGNFAGNYVGEYARTSTRTSTRVLPYTRSLSFTGDFVGNYARNYSANYTRTPAYTRTLYYAGDFVGNYARTRTGSYEGNYARTRVTNFAGNFTGNYTRGVTYTGNYNRNVTYTGNYARSVAYTRTRTVTSTQAATFTRTSTRTSTTSGTTVNDAYVANYFVVTTGWVRDSEGGVTINQVYIDGMVVAQATGASVTQITAGGVTYYRGSHRQNFGAFVSRYGVTYQAGGGSFAGNFVGNYTGTQSFSTNYTGNYARNVAYTRNRVAAVAYTRNRAATLTYTRDRVTNFAGDFVGNYARNRAFSYEGNYARTSTRTSTNTGYYTRTLSYTGNYARAFTRNRTQVSTRTDTYTRTGSYVGDFVGNYARTSTRTSTRTRYSAYARTRVTNFVGDFSRVSTRTSTRTRYSAYARTRATDYTRTRNSAYSRTSAVTYTGNYARTSTRTSTRTRYSAYARTRATNYTRTRNSAYARTRITDYVGNFTRVSTRTSTRTRYSAYSRTRITDYVGDFTRVSTRNSTRNRGSAYARTSTRTRGSAYTRDRVTNFAGNFVGNYSRNFAGDFVGNYSRAFVGEYTGNYTGEYTRTSTRTRYSAYARTRLSTFVGQYANSYTRHRITSYSRVATAYPHTSAYNDLSNKLWDAGFMNNWSAPNTGSATGYPTASHGFHQNGDGNSIISIPDTPRGAGDVWDISNQDAESNADGGWNSSWMSVDTTKTYRYSVWVRRNTIGNGHTYLGSRAYNSGGTNVGMIPVHGPNNHGTANTNTYFVSSLWNSLTGTTANTAGEWFLLVGHVHPADYTGGVDTTSGIYNESGEKVANVNYDMKWVSGTAWQLHRAYLYYSTDTSTNQQFWEPRVDDMSHGSAPSIDLLRHGTPSYSRVFTGNYTGNYSRGFVGNYSRNFSGQYSRNFAGDFAGNYVGNFAGNYVGNYSRGFAGEYTGNYSRNFAGEYVGNYSRGFAGEYTGEFSGTYSRNFAGDYVGNYSRNFAGEYTGTYTNTFTGNYSRDFVGNYARDFAGNFVGDYARTFTGEYTGTYTRDFVGNFAGNYSRGFAGEYAGNYSRDFGGNYVGNYSRGFAGEYTGTFTGPNLPFQMSRYGSSGDPTRLIVGSTTQADTIASGFTNLIVNQNERLGRIEFVGTNGNVAVIEVQGMSEISSIQSKVAEGVPYIDIGVSGTVSNSTLAAAPTTPTDITEVRFLYNHTGNDQYIGSVYSTSTGFVGNYTGAYSRGFAGDYVGNYSREFAGEYTGAFTRAFSGQYVGNYSRDFVGEYTGNFSRDFAGEYTGTFTGPTEKVYQSEIGIRDAGTLISFGVGNDALAVKQDFQDQVTASGVNKIEIYSGTRLVYSVETTNGEDLSWSNYNVQSNLNTGYGMSVTNGHTTKLGLLSSSYAVRSVYGVTNDTNHFSFDMIKAYGTSGLISTVNYTSNLTTNLVDIPNGTAGFVGNYTGAYTRNITDSFVGNYSRNFVGEYAGNYARGFTGEYTGTFSRDFGGEYTGTYSRDFVGEYVGNYSRDFAGEYTGTFTGPLGRSYVEFDSSNQDGVTVPSAHIGSDDYTIEAWVYPTTSGGTRMIARKDTGGVGHGSWEISLVNGNKVRYEVKVYGSSSSTTGVRQLDSNTTLPVNQWSHIAIVGNAVGGYSPTQYQGGQNRINRMWINGQWQGDSMSDASRPPGSTKFHIMNLSSSSGTIQLGYQNVSGNTSLHFDGKISNFRIVKNAVAYPTTEHSFYNSVSDPASDSTFTPNINLSTSVSGFQMLALAAGNENIISNPNNLSLISEVGFVGNYTGAYTRNITDAYTGAYTRNFTGDYTGAYSRGFSGQYTGTFSRGFTGDFVNNFSRDFVGQYTGNYSRGFAGEYTGTFTGPVFPIVELVNQGVFANNPSNSGQFPAGWQNLNYPNTEPQITTALGDGSKRLHIKQWSFTPRVNNQRVMKQTINGLTPGREYELKIFAYDTSQVSDGAGGTIENPPALELVHGSTSEFVGEALTPRNHNFPPYNSDSVTFIASATSATLYVLRAVSVVSDISLKATQVLTGFAGNYVGNYSRDFVGDYTGDFSRDFAGEYTGNYSRSFTGEYTGTFSSYFTGNYTGNYSRTFAGEYTGTYTGPQQTAYQSDVGVVNGFGSSNGIYFSTATNSQSVRDTVMSAITGDTAKIEFCFGPNTFFSIESPSHLNSGILQTHNYYFNNSSSGYGITFSNGNNLIVTYDGSKSVNAQAYVLSKSFDTVKTYDVNGNLLQSVELTSNLTSNLVNVPGAVGYVGNYSRVRVSAYSRLRTSAYTGTYSRDRVSTYVGDFIGDYARNFAGNYTRSFEGNYARSFVGNYVGATVSDSLTNVTETYTLYVRVA